MNIGLIGSGGREHALCKKMYESNIAKKIVCFPGNAGGKQVMIQSSVSMQPIILIHSGIYSKHPEFY